MGSLATGIVGFKRPLGGLCVCGRQTQTHPRRWSVRSCLEDGEGGGGEDINYWVDRKWPLEFQEERVSIFT